MNDPNIRLIWPIDINTLFVVGEDDSLYIKLFDHTNDDNNRKLKDDFHLQKEEISLIKLYKFAAEVTDFFVNSEQKIV